MHRFAMLVVLGACDGVFDLEHIDEIDAPSVGDDDGDGVFALDNCPMIPNADQLDDDVDLVGNVCDPHPGEHDVVVDADGFGIAASNWATVGAWTKLDGAWQSPPATVGGTMSLPPRSLYRPALQIGFTIDAFDPALALRQVELHFDAPGQGDCAVRHDPNIAVKSQVVLHVEGTMYVSRQIVPDYEIGGRYVATYTRGMTSTCSISGQTLTRNDVADQFSTSPTVTLFRMQVTIDHVTLYEVMQ